MAQLKIYDGVSWQGVSNVVVNKVATYEAVGVSGDAGADNTLTLGIKGMVAIPYSGTITGWSITSLFGETGNVEFDVWKAETSPTVSDSIVNSNYPVMTNAKFAEESNLSGWTTTTVTLGEVIGFYIRSNTDLRGVTLNLWITKDV